MSTKPKRERGSRITLPGKRKKHQKGRPAGTRKKRLFQETRLGFMLKYETPLEYDIIMSSVSSSIPFPQPDVNLIEAVANASDNTSFKKPKFKRYLEEYRENGIICDRAKILTPNRQVYYDKIRLCNLKRFTSGRRVKLKQVIREMRG